MFYDKQHVDDYLKQIGSVDVTRNQAFHGGAQWLDAKATAKVLELEKKIAELEAGKKTSKKK